MKDLMFSTVAMQERHNRRIEGAVAALEEIKRERMKPTNDVIREIFLAHGFKIPPELTDMRPYVYEAARALLRHYGVWINDITSRTIGLESSRVELSNKYVLDEEEQYYWTTKCPSKQGWYMHICDENDGGVDKLRVYQNYGRLLVDVDCGTYEINHYHSGVINPKWCFWGDL